jgi:hypothetical protein
MSVRPRLGAEVPELTARMARAGNPAVTKTIRLSFPPATGAVSSAAATAAPQECTAAPIATSDGRAIICGGIAATAMNNAGYANVGIWITDDNQGANLYVRTLDGRFRQVPWPGLFHYPDVTNIQEPPVAW